MEINYKGVLCRLGTYRVNGERTIRKINKVSKEAFRKIIMQDIKETLNID